MALYNDLCVKNTFLNYKDNFNLDNKLRKIKSDSDLLNYNIINNDNIEITNIENDNIKLTNSENDNIKLTNNENDNIEITNSEINNIEITNSENNNIKITNSKNKKLNKKKLEKKPQEHITDLDYLNKLEVASYAESLPFDKIYIHTNLILKCEYIITNKLFVDFNNKILQFKNSIYNTVDIIYKNKNRKIKLIKKLIEDHINTIFNDFRKKSILNINNDIFKNIDNIMSNKYYILEIIDVLVLKYHDFLPLELPIEIKYIIDYN